MVIAELRAPIYDEEAGEVVWRSRAVVTAQDGELRIMGDAELLGDETMTVIDLASGEKLSREHDPEGWVRNLPGAYRAGDLVALVVADTDPPAFSQGPDEPGKLPAVGTSHGLGVRSSSAAKA